MPCRGRSLAELLLTGMWGLVVVLGACDASDDRREEEGRTAVLRSYVWGKRRGSGIQRILTRIVNLPWVWW